MCKQEGEHSREGRKGIIRERKRERERKRKRKREGQVGEERRNEIKT